MTLSFSTQINGKPTYFMEKISKTVKAVIFPKPYDKKFIHPEIDVQQLAISDKKMHTIRADKKDRWKVGNKIHFVINNRTKDRFQFAPVIPVKSIQKIEIVWVKNTAWVYIDDNEFSTFTKTDTGFEYGKKLQFLSKNDGFDSVDDFFKYFDSDFVGKIIHWTNLSYCG